MFDKKNSLEMLKEIKKAYKSWAKDYDYYDANIAILVERERFLDVVNPSKKDIILDAGCGTGRYISELKKKCKKVIGVDFSSDMLEVARYKNPDVEFYQADLTKGLSFKKESFDKIISSLVFSHFKDIEPPLREMHRLLKKGGRIFITDFPWHAPIDWKTIRYKKKIKYFLDVNKTSINRPIVQYIDKATLVGFNVIGIIPLRIRPTMKKYLTNKSYEKNKNKWGLAVYIFEK